MPRSKKDAKKFDIKVCLIKNGYPPVSYTHLDVYKRQVLANRAQLLFCKFLSILIIMRLLMRRLSRYVRHDQAILYPGASYSPSARSRPLPAASV